MIKKVLSVTLLAMALTSCASIVNGENQSVSVKTGEIKGANCTLKNNKGTWFVNSTPASVTVHRSYQPLDVSCAKPGYGYGDEMVKSKTKAMAFGNIVFGGAIGAGVDMADGAAYDYPDLIDVSMSHRKHTA